MIRSSALVIDDSTNTFIVSVQAQPRVIVQIPVEMFHINMKIKAQEVTLCPQPYQLHVADFHRSLATFASQLTSHAEMLMDHICGKE